MSRQDVGESRAAPGMARPGGQAEILKQRRDRAAAGGQDGSPGSRGRGGWRPLVGRPQGQTETPCRLASETFSEPDDRPSAEILVISRRPGITQTHCTIIFATRYLRPSAPSSV